MDIRFSIKVAWKISLKTNQNRGKRRFIDLFHGVIFFQRGPETLHASPCMDIKWNSPLCSGGTGFDPYSPTK